LASRGDWVEEKLTVPIFWDILALRRDDMFSADALLWCNAAEGVPLPEVLDELLPEPEFEFIMDFNWAEGEATIVILRKLKLADKKLARPLSLILYSSK
jgi:hypothetical protein